VTGHLAAFLPELLDGFLINLWVAFAAVVIGLVFGLPLALIRHSLRWTEVPIRVLVRLLQAAPVYVIMFFLLNLLPARISVLGWQLSATALSALILAQAANMVAYMEENALQALLHLRRRERAQAILFVPNVMRGFIVVVMSSGIGAAIGVSEAVGVTLRHAQRLPDLGDRVMLFLLVIFFFVSVFGTANVLLRRAMHRLRDRNYTRRPNH
jgi:His/Glu/Gln/Arg/opine family amino acid ABC transporter permease subunit